MTPEYRAEVREIANGMKAEKWMVSTPQEIGILLTECLDEIDRLERELARRDMAETIGRASSTLNYMGAEAENPRPPSETTTEPEH